MSKFLRLVALGFGLSLPAQQALPWKFTGGAELYFAKNLVSDRSDLNPLHHTYHPDSAPRLHLAMGKVHFEKSKFRANAGLMTGTYAGDNTANEKGILRHLFELNAGVRLSSKHNLWVDAGLLPSHIGWETAQGWENLQLSRSQAADNSPYYETGVRLSYTSPSGNWYLAGLVLNGWQRMSLLQNFRPSFGHQLQYKPGESQLLNSSSFVGTDTPGLEKDTRIFHNLYWQETRGRFTYILGLDTGWQGRAGTGWASWYSLSALGRYQVTPPLSVSLRAENFHDPEQIIQKVPNAKQPLVWGYSGTVDYRFLKYMMFRTELQSLHTDGDRPAWFLTTSLAAFF